MKVWAVAAGDAFTSFFLFFLDRLIGSTPSEMNRERDSEMNRERHTHRCERERGRETQTRIGKETERGRTVAEQEGRATFVRTSVGLLTRRM